MFCCADTGHDARYVPRDGQSSTCCRRTALVLMRVVWVHVYILHIPTPYMYIYICVCVCMCIYIYQGWVKNILRIRGGKKDKGSWW